LIEKCDCVRRAGRDALDLRSKDGSALRDRLPELRAAGAQLPTADRWTSCATVRPTRSHAGCVIIRALGLSAVTRLGGHAEAASAHGDRARAPTGAGGAAQLRQVFSADLVDLVVEVLAMQIGHHLGEGGDAGRGRGQVPQLASPCLSLICCSGPRLSGSLIHAVARGPWKVADLLHMNIEARQSGRGAASGLPRGLGHM
jgi:hypothetical protein